MPVPIRGMHRHQSRATSSAPQPGARPVNALDSHVNSSRNPSQLSAKRYQSVFAQNSFINKASIAGTNKKLGDGVPGFQTSFNVSGKGGGAFRAISENFTVNPANGTLSLGLPIRTSPSRGGFGPSLNLSYDSGSGNGPFGFGWGVGSASVSRKTSRGIPTYTDDDDFVFSGRDIVAELKDNGDRHVTIEGDFIITRFRPRIDSRSVRIERWCRKGSDDIHWRTTSADNVTSIFGDNNHSQIFDSTGPRKHVFSWLLSRTYDAHGNAMEYSYKQEDGKGIADELGVLPIWEQHRTNASRCRQKYLKRIKYGNRVPNRDLKTWEPSVWPKNWMFEVVFDYGDHDSKLPATAESGIWPVRKDAFSQSRAGFEIRQYRLVRRLLMFHHFPERYGLPENLVFSQSFGYDESPQRTLLTSIIVHGHALTKEAKEKKLAQYQTESLPVWTLQYTTGPKPEEMEALEANTVNLVDPPSKSAVSEWLDLESEGIPGLLNKLQDGTMTYQQHTFAGFRLPTVLDQQPSLGRTKAGGFQDLDRNGHLDLVCLDAGELPQGFFEREDSDTWSTYSEFPETPTENAYSENTMSIDLTGDGTADVLCELDESQQLVWKQSLGKKGQTGFQRTYSSNSIHKPRLTKTTEAQTYVADFTGDGLSDLVEISAGCITYWQNHGHGTFGEPVVMGNPPLLSQYGEFDHARVRLIDVDGSGTTDLLYILPAGGAVLFYNLAGNSWSDQILIPMLPCIADPSLVFVLDIQGSGTACLCWASELNSADVTGIRYLDLMGSTKPHLLKYYANGMGGTTSVNYCPSTKYYLEDAIQGKPWTTKLPFPVQVISKTEISDDITGHLAVSEYKYHNGCYDPIEQQFAGFELVEHVRKERLIVGDGETYETPPALTKSWFNVGLDLHIDESSFFTPSQVSSTKQAVEGENALEALLAIRGSKVRTEIYSQDGTEKSEIPFGVQEFSYDINQIQPRGSNKHAVVQITPRASITTQLERNPDDARVSHEIVLKTNPFGDIEQTLAVVYPRKTESAVSTNYINVQGNQIAGKVTHTQTWFTNSVDDRSYFRKPVAWRHQDHEIIGFSFSGLLDVETVRKLNITAFPETKNDCTWKVIRSEERALYMKSDLSGPLPAGKIEGMSVLDQLYALAFTPEILTKVEEGQKTCGVTVKSFPVPIANGYLAASNGTRSTSSLLKDGGYIQIDEDNDGRWWSQSPRSFFGNPQNVENELQCARKSFYIPTVCEDVFGNWSFIKLDEISLLAEESQDAIGNSFCFENDYEHLHPIKITDPNLNSHQVTLDTMGRAVATAVLGKGDNSKDIDSLDGLVLSLQDKDVDMILVDPLGATAKRLLGNSGTRVIHCLDRFTRWKSIKDASDISKADGEWIAQTVPQPALLIQISRDRSFRESTEAELRVEVTYLDGTGNPCQQFTLNDPLDPPKAWVTPGISVSDSGGHVFRTFQPHFVPSPNFIPFDLAAGNATTTFYDATGRKIASLAPDHLWSKSIFTPWSSVEFGVSDLVLQNPLHDSDVKHLFSGIKSSRFLPTWYEKQQQGSPEQQSAATKSKAFADCPTMTHFGSCGLPLRQVRQVGQTTITQAFAYDASGNKIQDFDSMDRLVAKNTYDKLHRQLLSSSMDNGDSWVLQDVNGDGLVSWNSRGVCFQHQYDRLRREVETWMHSNAELPKLVVKITYGEDNLQAATMNLKGQVWSINDQSGTHINSLFNIRGYCTEKSFQPAREYKRVLDWQTDNALEKDSFTHKSTFDYFGQTVQDFNSKGGGNCTGRRFSHLGHVLSVEFCRAGSKNWECYLKEATFTEDGLPLKSIYGNGVSTELSYDPESRHVLSQRTTLKGKNRPVMLEDFAYFYDCCSRRTFVRDNSEETKYFRNGSIKAEWDYTYNEQGQLIAATGRGQLPSAGGRDKQLLPHTAKRGMEPNRGSVDGSQLYKYLEIYNYDIAGNITSMRHEAPEDPYVRGWTRHYFYEEQSLLSNDSNVNSNRLSKTRVGSNEEKYSYGEEEHDGHTYDYDSGSGKIGCMTTLPPYSRVTWNMNNLMASSSTHSFNEGTPETTYYVYDHSGNRVRKVTESAASTDHTPIRKRDTLYLQGLEIHSKLSTNNGISVRWISRVSGSELLAMVESTNDNDDDTLVRYQIGNDMELDWEGQLISYEEYSPFGTTMFSAMRNEIEAPRRYCFAAYERDHETGLYACGARYYAPWLGRWTSPDPLGMVDGPSTYAYCSNDPVNWIDPKGTSKFPARNFRGKPKVVPPADANALEPRGRRRGTGDVFDTITTSQNAKKLTEIIDKGIRDQNSMLTNKINDTGGLKGVAVTTIAFVAGQSVKNIPAAGPIIKLGIDYAAGKYKKGLAASAEDERRLKYTEAGHAAGVRAANQVLETAIENTNRRLETAIEETNRRWQTALRNIQSQYGDDPEKAKEAMDNLIRNGPGGETVPQQSTTNIKVEDPKVQRSQSNNSNVRPSSRQVQDPQGERVVYYKNVRPFRETSV